jgi:uncharacterized protein (DUF2384 family)
MLQRRSTGGRGGADLRKDIKKILADEKAAEIWLETENDQLGGQKPIELLEGSPAQQQILRDLIDAIKYGMPT